jgi:cytochrome d ubiquinol oxidase subunit II
MNALPVAWFFLIGFFLIGYAILDGFDLGVGFWYFFTGEDNERRLLLNAIGPVWDGNEVWLLIVGGATFAAFPHVYATVFSGLYLALMLVLFALILRAVSIEFRNGIPSPRWHKAWDVGFAVGSVIPAFLFGVAFGNILRGLPLDETKNFAGTFFDLLNPYALLIGLLGFSMLATHGALYLVLKIENNLVQQAADWARKAWYVYLGLFVIASAATMITQPRLLANYKAIPVLWLLPLFALGTIIMIGVFSKKGEQTKAFTFSALSIVGLMAMSGVALFPSLVPALDKPELSLTVMNASSSSLTLKIMLILALVGMPIVIGYTVWVYRTFAGKVKLESDSY